MIEPEAILYLDMYVVDVVYAYCVNHALTCMFAWRIHTHACMAWAASPIYLTGGFVRL